MVRLLHGEDGLLTAVLGRPARNGDRLEVACSCGVMFGRWATPEDAASHLTLERLHAGK
jgi:hypothetical protein